MNANKVNKLSEVKKIALSFVVFVLLLKIIFFKETLLNVLKSAASIYWILILPGIGLTYIFHNLSFVERIVASIAIGASILGISSYYAGLLGIHIKYSAVLLPTIFIMLSAIVMFKESEKINNNAPEVNGTHP